MNTIVHYLSGVETLDSRESYNMTKPKKIKKKKGANKLYAMSESEKPTFRALFFSAGRSSLDASSRAITNRSYLVHLTSDDKFKSS